MRGVESVQTPHAQTSMPRTTRIKPKLRSTRAAMTPRFYSEAGPEVIPYNPPPWLTPPIDGSPAPPAW
jgi:hypothetical protein